MGEYISCYRIFLDGIVKGIETLEINETAGLGQKLQRPILQISLLIKGGLFCFNKGRNRHKQ